MDAVYHDINTSLLIFSPLAIHLKIYHKNC